MEPVFDSVYMWGGAGKPARKKTPPPPPLSSRRCPSSLPGTLGADVSDGTVGIEAQHGVPRAGDRAFRCAQAAREHVCFGGECGDVLER